MTHLNGDKEKSTNRRIAKLRQIMFWASWPLQMSLNYTTKALFGSPGPRAAFWRRGTSWQPGCSSCAARSTCHPWVSRGWASSLLWGAGELKTPTLALGGLARLHQHCHLWKASLVKKCITDIHTVASSITREVRNSVLSISHLDTFHDLLYFHFCFWCRKQLGGISTFLMPFLPPYSQFFLS